MRILIVISSYPPVVGGGETHARAMAGEWARGGHEVAVLTRRLHRDAPEDRVEDGVRVVRLRAPGGKRFGKYGFLRPLRKWLEKNGRSYDCFYVCAFRVLGWAVVPLANRFGKVCVLRAEACGEWTGGFAWDSAHLGHSSLRKRLLRPLIQLRNRRLIRADALLAISPVVAAEYRAAGVPEEQIVEIGNGIDLGRFAPPASGEKERLRRELGFGDRPTWVYSGKLIRGKGLELLLQAWVEIVQKQPLDLVLIGSGEGQFLSCERELRATASANALQGYVRFTGYVENVEAYLKAADGFVFPSEMESFGLAPFEASACGLPVVTSDGGALGDLFEDGVNARVFPVGDAKALVQAVLALAADPALMEAIAGEGSRRTRENHGFEKIAAAHIQCFSRLLKERKEGRS